MLLMLSRVLFWKSRKVTLLNFSAKERNSFEGRSGLLLAWYLGEMSLPYLRMRDEELRLWACFGTVESPSSSMNYGALALSSSIFVSFSESIRLLKGFCWVLIMSRWTGGRLDSVCEVNIASTCLNLSFYFFFPLRTINLNFWLVSWSVEWLR